MTLPLQAPPRTHSHLRLVPRVHAPSRAAHRAGPFTILCYVVGIASLYMTAMIVIVASVLILTSVVGPS